MRPTRAVLAGLALAGSALTMALPAGAAVRPQARHHSSPTITIGTTTLAEQEVVAQLYADVLTHAGIKVSMKPPVASREAIEPALAHGAVDLYPDYAGSLLIYLDHNRPTPAAQVENKDVPALRKALAKQGATVLNPAPAIDVNVFAVTKQTANKDHLTNLSSLKRYASKLTLGGPPECPQRALCEIGLQKTYGLKFKSFVSTDESGPISVEALKSGRAQVVEFFSTYVDIKDNHFVELADNKHLQPADHLIPVIRKSVDTTKVRNVLNKLSAKLTTTQLEQLNAKYDSAKKPSIQSIASGWLKKEHLG